MRDFLEDLGKRIGETAETMTNMAGDAIEIQRMKGQIRSLARGNAVDLMELGKTIYDRYKAGGEVGEEAAGRCDAIKDREAAIGEYEKKIAKIKGASECSNCGKMVGKDMAFCPYCGEKVISDAEEESDDPSDDYASQVREKMADAAEKVAGKADEAARKVGDMAEKAAAKTGDIAEKAAEKINDAAEKVSDKLNEK
ncbi:MAG TPA: zinc ribbon domain-containing protein [Candidatus Mediterraneibacter intestinigallinarum]|nr:zinc ribbon domain-containing protein [Candidatus Mediterraneibacter intestinigallinarum]